MPWLNPLVVIYALLNIVLGIMGAVNAHEYYSLAGVLVGLLVLGCLVWTKTNPRAGRIGTLVLAVLMLGKFSGNFFSKGQWYPAGIEVVASAILIVALLAGHFMATVAKKRSNPAA